jgi:hypothetical protein
LRGEQDGLTHTHRKPSITGNNSHTS